MLSLNGVSLEGLEIAVIVVALGSAARDLASASAGAALAVVALSALGALAHRSVARIPRRSIRLLVGVMLTSFGTFWAAGGAGAHWPGGEWALVIMTAGYLVMSLAALLGVRRLRAAGGGGGPVSPAPAGEAARRMAGAALAFLRFRVDFVLGDDWTVAATAGAAVAAISAWWLLPAAVVGVTYAGLRRAVLSGG